MCSTSLRARGADVTKAVLVTHEAFPTREPPLQQHEGRPCWFLQSLGAGLPELDYSTHRQIWVTEASDAFQLDWTTVDKRTKGSDGAAADLDHSGQVTSIHKSFRCSLDKLPLSTARIRLYSPPFTSRKNLQKNLQNYDASPTAAQAHQGFQSFKICATTVSAPRVGWQGKHAPNSPCVSHAGNH
ncbi:hypothetical protein D3C81_1280080 [compost metagenome]